MELVILLTKEDIQTTKIGLHYAIKAKGVTINFTPDALEEFVNDVCNHDFEEQNDGSLDWFKKGKLLGKAPLQPLTRRYKMNIPTQQENPHGLHQRYYIQKIVPTTREDAKNWQKEFGNPLDIYSAKDAPSYKLVDLDKDAEYFVLRLDDGGSDPEHIKACRIGIHAYADAIEHKLPELAKDLRERYPLKSKEDIK